MTVLSHGSVRVTLSFVTRIYCRKSITAASALVPICLHHSDLFEKKITEAEFTAASAAIRLFVLQVESLYGKQYMKYNVHILLHIPKS